MVWSTPGSPLGNTLLCVPAGGSARRSDAREHPRGRRIEPADRGKSPVRLIADRAYDSDPLRSNWRRVS